MSISIIYKLVSRPIRICIITRAENDNESLDHPLRHAACSHPISILKCASHCDGMLPATDHAGPEEGISLLDTPLPGEPGIRPASPSAAFSPPPYLDSNAIPMERERLALVEPPLAGCTRPSRRNVMNGPRTRLLVSILALVVLLAPMARAQTFGVPFALERAVHFPTADGRIVLMEAGSYLLEQEGLNLRLRPAAGGEGLLLQSSVMAHDKTVAGPVALSIPGRGAYPDIHMVVLLLPAGEGLRAFGSYSGVMPRGFGSWISDRIDDV